MKKVLIAVLGGVASVIYASNDVEVRIVDFDDEPDADLDTEICAFREGES